MHIMIDFVELPVADLSVFLFSVPCISRYDEMIPTWLNAHRILLISVMLAIKSSEDLHFDNLHFSKIGGVPLPELNDLEVAMLQLLNFDLRISMEEIEGVEAGLIQEAMESNHPLSEDTKSALAGNGLSLEAEMKLRKRLPSCFERASSVSTYTISGRTGTRQIPSSPESPTSIIEQDVINDFRVVVQ